MRRISEKVAIIAQICITAVFVITTLLYIANVIPESAALANNGMLATLIVILAIVYGLLSAYLIYANFSERENLRRILLFCDSESATHTNGKVIRNIVRSCARKVRGIRVRRAKLKMDETQGLSATIVLTVSAQNVSQSIDKLRCLIADAFKNTLGLTFNTINFEIRKLKSRYKPNVERAEELAQTLTEQRELSADIYQQPFRDNCKACESSQDRQESSTQENEASYLDDTKDFEKIRKEREEALQKDENSTSSMEQVDEANEENEDDA